MSGGDEPTAPEDDTMSRTNQKITRWTDSELALVETAAAIANPTTTGGNVARFIRESSLAAAEKTLWPTLESLMVAMRDGDSHALDIHGQWRTDLPSYGGEAPSDTVGVWSWDADRLLVGESASDLEIVNREDW